MARTRLLQLKLDAPTRLDLAILRALGALGAPGQPGPSRARLKQLLQAGAILLDGRPAPPSLEVPRGAYEITLPDPLVRDELAQPSPRGCFLNIVYEDSGLLVLDKPSGVASLPHSRLDTETAVSAALAHDPGLARVGRSGLEPGLLHRLDTGTSGLLAFARTPQSYEWTRQAWRDGRVKKLYRALAPPLPPGAPPLPAALRLWLGHDAKSAKRMKALGDSPAARPGTLRGKPLETLTRLIRAVPHGGAPGVYDYEIEIQTGVMHQIRCTLASLGSPILGDPIYGGLPSERLWLHAWKLRLPLPQGGELELDAPVPWSESP